MTDRWFSPDHKDEVDRKVAEAIGWEIRGVCTWYDGDRETKYQASNDRSLGGYKWTPSEYEDEALEAARLVADRRRIPFSLARDSHTWKAEFQLRGRPSIQSSNVNLARAICEAIVKLGDDPSLKRRYPAHRGSRERDPESLR